MAISSREQLAEHQGHDTEVVIYKAAINSRFAGGESVTIECVTCGCVLIAAEDLEWRLNNDVAQDPLGDPLAN